MATSRLCSIPDCGKPHLARGWCVTHYHRWERHGSPDKFIHQKRTKAKYANKTPEYRAWAAMKHRCFNPNNKSFHNYGGRGITVCDEWTNDFDRFLTDMGHRPSTRHSIDRRDGNGNYEPSNCRWATQREQMNNVCYNHKITVDGLTLTVAEWSRRSGTNQSTIYNRIYKGWDAARAVGITSF